MALRDEIRRERQAVAKNGTWKDKWNYFTDYYLVGTIAIIAVIAFGINFIYTTVTKPDVVLNGAIVNTLNFEKKARSVNELADDFEEYAKINTEEEEVTFSGNLSLTGDQTSDYQTSQAITVPAQAGVMDFVICPLENILDYAYGGLFVDLNTVLTPAQMEALQPYFIYIDKAVVKEREEAFDNDIEISEIPIPDSKKPDAMKEPVPIFLNISACEKVTNTYAYEVTDLVFGICMNAPNSETICKFVDYIMNE